MLNKKRTAIIFTANTPHLAHANLMLNSLRDESKGNFKGDIWVISTGLSARAKNYLDSIHVNYLVSSLYSLKNWRYWKEVAQAQPEYEAFLEEHSEEDSLRLAFELYRNKRMSKLIILDWIKKFGENYDFIALGDNDLYFQRDVHELFSTYYQNEDKVHYWHEENEMQAGTSLWRKNLKYASFHDATEIDFGKHEINIGFIFGKPNNIYNVFKEVQKSFFSINIKLFLEHKWHDQDLVRLDRGRNPERYELVNEGDLVHICNGGMRVVEERYPREFYHLKTGKKPFMIHFAGGTWEKYFSIKATYKVDVEDYYFSNELKKDYDGIRLGSFQNLFDDISDRYYTKQNKKSKDDCRSEWLRLSNNNKNKVVFIGWLQTKTHKSTLKAIPEFFDNDLYDIAVLNGNISNEVYEGMFEDFPIIISEITRIIKDAYLVRTYGIKIPGVPEWLYDNISKSVVTEYRCTKRQAIAVATLVYLYFSEALDFYSPDVVCIWGMLSPWGKMISDICKWKKIPIASLEWGILPGTVALDFNGHMAESWLSVNSDFYNRLSISEEDINQGKRYLDNAQNVELSRNFSKEMDSDTIRKISKLREKNKKIILYMESNSAHSGNSLFDPKQVRLHSPFYNNDQEAYKDLLSICKNHSDWHILYKPHPISISRGIQTEIDEEYTTVIYEGSLEKSFELCDVSITILSQSAYVSLINDTPVILLGRIQLNDSGAAYVLEDKSDFEKIIEDALREGYSEAMQRSFLYHVSRALKYYVFKANTSVQARDSYQLGRTMIDIISGQQEESLSCERKHYLEQVKEKNEPIDNPLVSIIMPVYNAEEYLAACINSICNQSMDSLELICVNNGSTDKSQAILEYFAKRDSRIKLFTQEEANQRLARNLGYNNAKGKYVCLIDSDDYLDLDALEKLTEVAESKNADVLYYFFREVRTDFSSVRPRPRWYSYKRFLPSERVFKLEQEYKKFFIQYPFPWAKLMRRDLVTEKELYFDMDCINFDDNPHNIRTLLSAQNAYVLNEQLYNFRIHKKSMTQSKNPRIIGMIDAVRIMNDIYKAFDCYDEYAKWYVPYKIHIIAWAWDLLPDDLREEYYNKVKKVFLEDDKPYMHDDMVWSYYEMPSSKYMNRVTRMLEESYEEFIKM